VHWLVLLVASCVFDALAEKYAPQPYFDWVTGLFLFGWALYFCFWLRRLDPKSVDYRWWIGVVVSWALGESTAGKIAHTSWHIFVSLGLLIAFFSLYVVLIFSIRATLLKHYNEREPVGLTLSPLMTLVFSFFYFQYHLYPIAQFKDRVARGDIANPGRTFLS
jgi:hypothetical protein